MAGEELEKTRGQTAAATAAATEQQEEPTTSTGKMKRTTTMAQTAEVQCLAVLHIVSFRTIPPTGLYHSPTNLLNDWFAFCLHFLPLHVLIMPSVRMTLA